MYIYNRWIIGDFLLNECDLAPTGNLGLRAWLGLNLLDYAVKLGHLPGRECCGATIRFLHM